MKGVAMANRNYLISVCLVSAATFLLQAGAVAVPAGQPWAPPKDFKVTGTSWAPPAKFVKPATKPWSPPKGVKPVEQIWRAPAEFKGGLAPWTPPAGFTPVPQGGTAPEAGQPQVEGEGANPETGSEGKPGNEPVKQEPGKGAPAPYQQPASAPEKGIAPINKDLLNAPSTHDNTIKYP